VTRLAAAEMEKQKSGHIVSGKHDISPVCRRCERLCLSKSNCTNGYSPLASLIIDAAGHLHNAGTVFELP
jgi:hypothetical protein